MTGPEPCILQPSTQTPENLTIRRPRYEFGPNQSRIKNPRPIARNPERDRPIGGGGLTVGIAVAVKHLRQFE